MKFIEDSNPNITYEYLTNEKLLPYTWIKTEIFETATFEQECMDLLQEVDELLKNMKPKSKTNIF